MTELTPWGTFVTVRVSRAAPDADPDWVDITDYCGFRDVGRLSTTSGRQTELQADEPAQLELSLKNGDHRFTSGNPTSPYWPWWKQGRRIWITETFDPSGAALVFDLYNGYIEMPTTTSYMDTADGMGTDLVVTLTATDRLARLLNARRFVSTLGAHVLGSAPEPNLVAYYPLGDVSTVTGAEPVQVGSRDLPRLTMLKNAFGTGASVAFGGSGVPIGDDLPAAPTWTWDLVNFFGTQLIGNLPTPIVFSAGQALTLIAWCNFAGLDDVGALVTGPQYVVKLQDATHFNQVTVGGGTVSSVPSTCSASIASGVWSGSVTSVKNMPVGRYTLVGARFQLSATTPQELWLDDATSTAAAGGSPPASMTFTQISIGDQWAGAICHVQVYLGSPSVAPSNADFQAQRQVGVYGLANQTTGQRVSTLLDYSGIPSTIRDIDQGASMMSMARLAGKTPAEALAEPTTTEQGRLFMSPSGRFQFHGRARVLNV